MLAANMDQQSRAQFKQRYTDLNLKLSATCGDFGLDFGNVELMTENEPKLKDL